MRSAADTVRCAWCEQERPADLIRWLKASWTHATGGKTLDIQAHATTRDDPHAIPYCRICLERQQDNPGTK